MSNTHDNITPEARERFKEQNPRIILKTLMDGGEWHYDNKIFVLADNYELCVVAWELDAKSFKDCKNEEKGKRVYLKSDISLGAFIRMALDTNLDETVIMAANSALKHSLKF